MKNTKYEIISQKHQDKLFAYLQISKLIGGAGEMIYRIRGLVCP